MKTNRQSTINKRQSQTASEIYNRQNKLIHRAFADIGMPYIENRDVWVNRCKSLCKRNVQGLSDMTLHERRGLIDHLKKQGAKLSNPFVYQKIKDWKKHNPDITVSNKSGGYGYPGRPAQHYFDDPEKGPMLKKVEALLADAKRPWNYVHSMAKHMAGVDRVEWCNPHNLHKIVAALVIDAKRRKGRG